jgi:alanine-glyoxylate transaminase/serine-glyoxylate transaminase/serine-pyruvate transaminase
LCRYVFQTDTKYVLSMSGTGHSGMEACIANLVEPGETVLVGNKGIWGARVADLAGRYGANVVELKTGGEPRAFTFSEIKAGVEKHKPALLFLCQGESSMGARLSFCVGWTLLDLPASSPA